MQSAGQQGAGWNTAAKRLKASAAELGDQIKSFTALEPPAAVASLQDEFIKALRKIRGQIEKTATALKDQDPKWTVQRGKVMAQVSALQAKIAELSSAVGALMSGGKPSPSPSQ